MMKKLITIIALIGIFLIPVNSFAVTCGAVGGNDYDYSDMSYFMTVVNNYSSNGAFAWCDNQVDYHSVTFRYNNGNTYRISCEDCGLTYELVGGTFSHYDFANKFLYGTSGAYWDEFGVYHEFTYHVSSYEDFCVLGKRMDDNFTILVSVPAAELPLKWCHAKGLLFSEIDIVDKTLTLVEGTGKTDGVLYTTRIVVDGGNTSSDLANSLQDSRDNGVDIFDEREQELRDIKQDLAETHVSTRVNEKGAELKFAGNDYKVYVPENSFDDVPFVLTNDFIVDFSSEPDVTNDPALFSGAPGSTLLQKEGIELLAQLFDDNASTNNAGNLSLQITENGAELTFKNSGIGISSVQNEGLGLTQGDIEAIRDSLVGSNYGASGSVIYIGSGSGGGSGSGEGGGQLPTDPAPSAEDGIGTKGDGEVYEPASYLGDLEKDCESIECVYSSYEAQFKQKPFIQLIGALVPPESNDPLPVISGVLLGAPYSIDFQEMSGGLDIFKNMLLITASITGIRIILASPA